MLVPSRTPANLALLSRVPPALWSNPNVRAMFPGLLGPDPASPAAPGGWTVQNRGNIPNYAAVLRPAVAAGLSGIPLTETLGRAADSEAAKRGLSPELRDAVMAVPALQNIQDAFNLADALEQTRTDIVGFRESGTAGVSGPSRLSTGLSGAASGATIGGSIGGPYGAAVGAGVGLVGGLLEGGKKTEGTHDEYVKRAANAQAEINPPGVQATLAGLVPDVREQTMISGEASGAQTAFQAALSRSGLRDSALGALGGIASAAIPDQMARAETLSLGLTTARRRVSELLGAPVSGTQSKPDRLTEALGAAAQGFLVFKSIFPTKQPSPSNSPFVDPDVPYNTPADVGEATSGG